MKHSVVITGRQIVIGFMLWKFFLVSMRFWGAILSFEKKNLTKKMYRMEILYRAKNIFLFENHVYEG